jgi:hypothetical protein
MIPLAKEAIAAIRELCQAINELRLELVANREKTP